MVKVYVGIGKSEMPIADIQKIGQSAFLHDVANNNPDFRGIPSERLRILYNGKYVTDEKLMTLTDDDAIRVIAMSEAKMNKPVTEERRQKVEAAQANFARLWSNPEDRRLTGFEIELGKPEHITKLVKKYPELMYETRFLNVLSDWDLFYSHCIENEFKDLPEMNEFKFKSALFPEVLKMLYEKIGTKYGLLGGGMNLGGGMAGQAQAPITAQLLQNNIFQALQAALGNMIPQQGASGGAGPAPPPQGAPQAHARAEPAPVQVQAPAPAPAQPEPEPMEVNYEQSMAMLREFGFENEELMMLALEQSNGDIQQAMEFLIEMNQS